MPNVWADALPVAPVIGVVAAALVEVDAPDERDVLRRTARIADDDHLLVVAAEWQDPLVEQDLAA